jgi:hypothetical protein
LPHLPPMRPADAKFRLRSFESVNTAPLIAINPSECCAATNSSGRTFGPEILPGSTN